MVAPSTVTQKGQSQGQLGTVTILDMGVRPEAAPGSAFTNYATGVVTGALIASKVTAFSGKNFVCVCVRVWDQSFRDTVSLYVPFHPLKCFVARFTHFYPPLIQQDPRWPSLLEMLELRAPSHLTTMRNPGVSLL